MRGLQGVWRIGQRKYTYNAEHCKCMGEVTAHPREPCTGICLCATAPASAGGTKRVGSPGGVQSVPQTHSAD